MVTIAEGNSFFRDIYPGQRLRPVIACNIGGTTSTPATYFQYIQSPQIDCTGYMMIHLNAILIERIKLTQWYWLCIRIKGRITQVHKDHQVFFVQPRQALKPVSDQETSDLWGHKTGSIKQLCKHTFFPLL